MGSTGGTLDSGTRTLSSCWMFRLMNTLLGVLCFEEFRLHFFGAESELTLEDRDKCFLNL